MQQSLLIQPFNINPPIPATNAINTVKAKQINVFLSDFSIYSFPFSSTLTSPKNRKSFIAKPHFKNIFIHSAIIYVTDNNAPT